MILVRWIPFLLGLGLLIDAVQGHGPDAKRHAGPGLIALEVLLGLACLGWAWWLRQRRLQREAAFAVQRQWAQYGLARYAQDEQRGNTEQERTGE